ncbi:gp055 [Rhodococcus phage ReqiPoco6]|uniref:Gp055 n=1 Tax=Rhodococcus phage ReqiPoco6 TaxID=691964 RepID=D4P7S3_9CAUD|nr:gp055 [Rhodococcus phage ReqiPoco6]ADD81053.1 gp055 [Rhodococcus phage ReqiPoco6]
MHHKEDREFTYEMGVDEPINPDPDIAGRMVEKAVSKCQYGCKLYEHPSAHVIVLSHNSSYGCKRTKDDILSDFTKNRHKEPSDA